MSYKGWLIYDEAGFKRNKWFAEHLLECAPEYGLELELKVLPTEGLEYRELPVEKRAGIIQRFFMESDEEQSSHGENRALGGKFDFAVMRVIAPEISEVLEARGIRLFNNGMTARIANNKWLTYQRALEWQIPVLKTCLAGECNIYKAKVVADMLQEEVQRMAISREVTYPQVIKAVAGHGGSQVYWAADVRQGQQIMQELCRAGMLPEEIICQQPCSEPGKDMRVYVLGGEIYYAVLRSSDRDFRSNFSLGGEIALAEPTMEQRQVIERLYEELKFDFVGIDFIAHEGGWILNEIEDVVGTRMIYQLTDKDPVRDYLAYIARTEAEQ